MLGRERKYKGAVVYSVALHAAVVAALTLSVHLPSWQREAGAPAPIQATIVDERVIEKQQQAQREQEQAKREEEQRQQREEKQRRDAEQKAQREREETVKREQELKAKQEIELKEKLAREQKAREDAAKREQERKTREAQAAKEKQAREQKAREDAAKAAKDAAAKKQQAQLEKDLQAQLAAEADRQQAERSGLMDQYILLIKDKIERHWTRPLSAASGLDCIVSVVQLPTGDVIEARVTSCNGDDAVRRSIEAAVKLASPLPRPPNPNLFERNLNVRFKPVI